LKHTENLLHDNISRLTKTLLLIAATLLLSFCKPSNSAISADSDVQAETAIVSKITINHVEIRRDILAQLQKRKIQYWINQDNSIGFSPADAEIIDSIYYEVVGAYAARN
jgi:hypothetical protein|tara:strand:- start:937 stop:1266 length:330 start_codon:yes stop_codon:yes gene_type:complete